MRLISRLLMLCAACFALPSLAAPLSNLYEVREPVADQQPEEREAALQRAFDTLVLRLTGDPEASQRPAVAELRKNPQQLISRYAYENEGIRAFFDPQTTERSLRGAGLALWGANRPSILSWWLVDAGEGARLIGDGQDQSGALRVAAQHRGLPLRLPLADLGEQMLGVAEAAQGQDAQALREASERYDADALLAVSAVQTGSQWEASWHLWLGEEQTRGKASGETHEALADAVMLAVSKFLAPRYTVAAGEVEDITLEVLGADVSRFAELEQLLTPLAGRLIRVESDRLVYRLSASPEQLRAQLALARLHEVPVEEMPVDTLSTEGQPPEQGPAEVPAPEAQATTEAPSDEGALPEGEKPLLQPDVGLLLRYRW
ncbi:DUF2066 domain-containing protein [Stutzerimonas nitrititolerans]|uniref:DUF2066 domain-containing protein n=1 Tax=Stutzerimonas nitrititolerans TaxID=2482751 RepID=UPI0028A27013|nr:DUF2066 domain-containing protein [Stutzerimonas nitrititolerans]